MSLKIKKWLEKLGMEDYYKLFIKFSVSDPMVRCLTKDTLLLMGIENEVHIEIILSHLVDFNEEEKDDKSDLRNRKEVEEMEEMEDITKGFGISEDVENEEDIKNHNTLEKPIYQTIKERYFTVHLKNNSLDEALSKICPVGSECEYKLNEKLINELKKKYN